MPKDEEQETNVEDQRHRILGLQVRTCAFYENKFHNSGTTPSHAPEIAGVTDPSFLTLAPHSISSLSSPAGRSRARQRASSTIIPIFYFRGGRSSNHPNN